jgi:hypothetical protein
MNKSSEGDYQLTDVGREALRIMALKDSITQRIKRKRFAVIPFEIAVLLIVIGVVVSAYSYTELQGQDVIFNKDSISIDGHTYVGYEIIVNLDGKFSPKVIGGVGSVGSGVDFYLVNDSSWNSWSTNQASRSALSMVHLSSTAVSSQSTEGQFSFAPSTTAAYSAVFVNDGYPNAGNATVHATITLQYMYLNSLYELVAGLAMLGAGFLFLIVAARRKAQQ